ATRNNDLVIWFSDLVDEKDRGRVSSVVLLDYSQAFDSISHDMLVAKMSYYGFQSANLQIMQSLILSVFYYCYPAYGNSMSGGDACRIQKVQNSAVRFIFCLNRQEHVSPFREKVGMAPMEDVCRVLTNCMTHKVLCL
ncbi:hypothetical protein J6590_072136, partial [Homalodisca vitripennis]